VKSISLLGITCFPTSLPFDGINCKVFLLIPALQKHSHNIYALNTESEAGFKITVFQAAKEAAIPPHGIAIGKFHGLTTKPTPLGLTFKPNEIIFETLYG
jgi:hypothetical protein